MKKIISSVEVLSQDEIIMIHNAALNTLDSVGISVPNNEALRRLKACGAKIDENSQVARIPKQVMEEFTDMMRKSAEEPFTGQCERLHGHISTQIFVNDYKTGTRRLGTSDDILKGIALVKHLRNIPNCNAVAIPSDVPSVISDLHAFYLTYMYSAKEGGTYIINPEAAPYIMDMADAMGRKVGYLLETVSPLQFRKEALDMALMFADRGQFIAPGPMVMGGSTGPMTLAGTLTLITAEILASLFSIWAITGQAGFFFGHGSHYTDPKTMLCSFGAPNQALIGIGAAQIGRFYGLKSCSNSALSDALQPDFQCGFEKIFSALFAMLAGTSGIGSQGIVGADQGFSFEQLVIDNEWLDAYNFVMAGAEVTAETIAEELIREVGIGGNFLAQEHTIEHLKDNWWPSRLFDRESFDGYVDGGRVSLFEKAAALVEEYTEGYKDMPVVLSAAKAEDLERIYRDASRKILSVDM